MRMPRKVKKELQKKNKELIQKYPFLQPRNVWTDSIPENFDYTYCLLKDEIPEGWWNRFGITYCEDLKEVLEKYNFLYEFRLTECKEKYGSLRAYHNGAPEEWNAHEYAWEYISSHTCVRCGKFPVPMRKAGWISPYCTSCFRKKHSDISEEDFPEFEKRYTDPDDERLLEFLQICHFSKDGETIEWIDMKPYYEKLGYDYRDNLISKEEYEEILKKSEEEEAIDMADDNYDYISETDKALALIRGENA